MCGIGGILRTDGKPIPEEWLDAIDARISYRGPDGAGRFRDRVEFMDEKGEKRVVEVAFVHRRLSIIDHADGAQPMVSERGRDDSEGLVAVVFNGCIYNHRELRNELEAKGHRFVTDHSDTEVLIHGWREWDVRLNEHLTGMYAFAVWDRHEHKLFMARDLYLKKPLYAVASASPRNDGTLFSHTTAFSSEPNAISHLPLSKAADAAFRGDMFLLPFLTRGYVTDEPIPSDAGVNAWPVHLSDTITVGNRGLESAARARDELAVRFAAFHPDELSCGRASSDIEQVEQLLETAVARRLEADVPLGCFLSGGIDSSLIAHFAKKHKPDLMTFCVRMPDSRYDESMHAEAVARHLGTNHHTLDVAMKPAEDLVHLIDILGQPFGDSSILPTYWVSKAARQHVKVALAGDGGDELFLGYERYMAAPFLARHWWWLRLLPAGFLHRAHPKSRWNKLARLVEMARDYPAIGIAAMESIFTQEQIRELTGLAVQNLHPGPPPATGGGRMEATAALRQFDLDHYLPGDLLRKTDTASMAVALEVRCPFLDRDLARSVLAMPIEQLIPNGERKGLLKQIARKYLPRECVDRPKMGFAIPIGEWFRDDDLPHKGAGMKSLLLDHLNSSEPFGSIQLNRKAVRRFIDEHMSGNRDHSHRLFTLLTLSIWATRAAAPSSSKLPDPARGA